MQGSLESRISALRGRVRRRLAWQGLCWVVLTLILAFLVTTWLDWFFPLAREVRGALLIGSAVLVAWVVWRTVLIPLFARFDDLEIALKIEQRWPGLNDRLSSTVEFLQAEAQENHGPEDRHGSRALREATIAQTLQEIESIDFREALDPRPMRLAGTLAAWAVACFAIITVAAPDFQRLALQRLLLGSQQWPRQTYLSVTEAPVKVARGDPFRLAVAAEVGKELPVIPPRIWFQAMTYAVPPLRLLEDSLNGRRPSSARVFYRFSDGETAAESLRPDDQGVFHGRLESVSRPFRFYVAAGDDATAWRRVEVVPPPALADVSIQLKAPAYTKPYLGEDEQDTLVETLAPGLTQARVVEGTEIRFDSSTNKPVVEAALFQDDEQTGHEVQITRQGRQLSTFFPLFGSASYWFSLLDDEGFRNREAVRYEIRTVADATPRVVIEEPLNDRFVRPNADVPIRVVVDDDYGVQLIRLVYTIAMADSEPSAERIIPVWTSEAEIDGGTARRQTAEYRWDLSSLNLQPGAIVTLYADARDFYASPDGSEGPNLGKSRAIRLRVIEDDEFRRLLDDRRREIREALERTLEIQRQARTPVREARNTLERTDQLPQRERERLDQAATNQQQVTNQIAGRTDGLDQKIRSFLDELRDSKLPEADGEEQMQEMLEAVERLRNENLNPAEQGLARASKALEGQPAGADEPRQPRDPADPAPADGEGNDPAPPQVGQPTDPQAQAKGQPQQGQPQQGQPQQGQPQEGQPQEGQPQQGQPQEGQPQEGQPQGGPQEAKQSLAEAEENQQAIAEELERMLSGLEQFETLKGVTQDAEKLLDRQEQALKESAEAVDDPELMGKAADELTPQQQADLENMAERQREVAQELQDLEARMSEMANRIEDSDPLAAAALRESVDQMRQQGTTARMGQAADQLQENQLGEAQQGQEQARDDLQELVDNLQNRKENDLARLVQELKEAEAQMQELRDQQLAHLEKTQEAQQIADQQEREERLQQLAKEQEQLQEQLRKQLQRLRKLRAEAAARAGDRASGRMADAQQDLEDGDAEAAAQNEEEVLNDLEQTQQEIADARRNAEEQLAMEQFLRMRDNLRLLGERQEKLLEDTVDYDQKRQEANGRLTRAESFDIRALARVQTGLRDETQVLVSRLDGAPVFKLTLERAVADMEAAARRLQRIETGEETQRSEHSASKRFQQLLEALKADQANQGGPQGGQPGGEGEGEGGPSGGAGDGIPTEAELKMLKALQEEINERTEHYEELSRRNQQLDQDQELELVRLEEDQGTIADLLRDIIQPRRPDGLED